MPYLYCEKTKQKMKIDIRVCFENLCPYIIEDGIDNYHCVFKSDKEKKIKKGKKK